MLGWGEFELEVMRDHADNVVIVCSIENIDPMGVHTGDTVTVAPQQTLTDRLYQKLRDQAIAVIRAVGVETGGSNVQFAVNPATDEIVVIEMNPRVSRSSALASKATGFPIAKIAARLAVGYTLDEIPNDITRVTPASFEPTLDYVVVKWPRFAFEKFPGVDATLSTHMKSVGEVMAIGRTFRQAFGKAMRSRELDVAAVDRGSTRSCSTRLEIARRRPLRRASSSVPRAASSDGEVHAPHRRSTRWFLRELRELASTRGAVRGRPHLQGGRHLRRRVRGRDAVLLLGLGAQPRPTEVRRGDKPSVMILGSGPNRIGQGIEFDYCCVHAAMTVRESGRDAVMVNCNPETVSTDYDTSDRLYFEPLTLEDVLGDRRGRAARGRDRPVRRPDAAAARRRAWRRRACRCSAPSRRRSTSPRTAAASARCSTGSGSRRRRTRLARLAEEALAAAPRRRLPAARAPELRARRPRDGDRLRRRDGLADYLRASRAARTGARSSSTASSRTRSRSTSTRSATARTSGSAAIMQHVEEAGIHSGDSACVLPPHSLGARDARRDRARRRAASRSRSASSG